MSRDPVACTTTSGVPPPASGSAAPLRDYSQEDYRNFWAGPSKSLLHQAECRILAEMLPVSSGWFFDIGCGYGRLLPTYQRPDRPLVLVDYALNLLELAARNCPHPNSYFVAANAYALPFRAEVFSAGLCVRAFHHIQAPQAFLKELARTLRPNSACILSYSNKRNLLRLGRHPASAFRRDHEAYAEMLFGTHPACFEALARQAGLGLLRSAGTGFLDQLIPAAGFFDRLLERARVLLPPLALAERLADRTLGRLGLAPLTFALLRKEGGTGPIPSAPQPSGLAEILACPHCRQSELVEQKSKAWLCSACGKLFPARGKIVDFR